MSDRALNWGARPIHLGIEFLCESSNSPPCGFLNGVMKPEL